MKYNANNKPLVCMMTNSTCYKGTGKMKVLGVLWHCTGANNPSLARYVQPYETDENYDEMIELLGYNRYHNDWNHIHRDAGLNAWIGKLADGTVTTVQTMPWDYRPWGCGGGSKGSCNNGWIQFEICEDGLVDKNYFDKVYKEACELTAYLCDMYNLDPNGTQTFNGVQVPVILCHADSCKLGLGSNHGDVYNWFNKHGKDMDDVRNDVAKLMGKTNTSTTVDVTGTASTGSVADEKKIWDYFMKVIANPYGVAGLMGNLYAESGLRSNNMQNSYESKLGYTDATYTAAVDNGSYDNFVKDSVGYGLAQWTYWSRKQELLDYAKSQKKSVGDFAMQLDFLYKELSNSYKGVLADLKNATSVLEASNSVLTKFERPANQDASVQKKRSEYGQKYYDKYTDKSKTSLEFKKGDIVQFAGGKHYSYASATNGAVVKASKAKITDTYESGKHPYHIRAVNDNGVFIGGVYGWVDASTISAIKAETEVPTTPVTPTVTTIAAGDKLTLKNVALYASASTSTKASTKTGVYYVWNADVISNRIRITNSKAKVGKSGQVTGWISYTDALNSVNAKTTTITTPPQSSKKSLDDWAKEVIEGMYGNGVRRKELLKKAGCPYTYDEVQSRVNELLK